jgi:hypothetical protein
MAFILITGFLFLLALNGAFWEVKTDKRFPRYTLKYLVLAGVPFFGFIFLYLGS